MIVFEGEFSKAALDHFKKRSFQIGQKIVLVVILLFSLPTAYLGIQFSNKLLILAALLSALIMEACLFIPKSKSEQKKITPKRITVDADHIVAIADRYSEAKLVKESNGLLDYGEYYEVSFPFGKLSEKFICQKNLLTQGTLTEFEQIFANQGIQIRRM